jgi:hypothetical protein
MSNNALRTARKVWKQIKYNLEDRSALELGSADDDLIEEIDAGSADDLIEEIDAGSADDGLIEEIDADQIKDIEKAIINALRTLTATGSWPVGHRDP